MADGMEVAVVVETDGVEKLRPVSSGIRDIGAAAQETSDKLPSFYEGVAEGGEQAVGAERGVRRLEFALTSMASQSLGVDRGLAGVSARVGEATLLFSEGTPAVLAAGAGLAAYGVTAHLLGIPLAEAEAENTKLAESFDKIASASRPSVKAMLELTAAARQFDETMGNLKRDAKLADLAEDFNAFGLLSNVRNIFQAAEITEASNLATEQTMGLLLAGNLRATHGADISKKGTAEISVDANRGQLSRLPQLLKERVTQLRNQDLGDAMTDALTEPLARGFEQAFVKGIQQAGERGDLREALRLRTKAIAGLAGAGLPEEMQQSGDDAINAAFLAHTKTIVDLNASVGAHMVNSVFRAETLRMPGGPFGERRPLDTTFGPGTVPLQTPDPTGLTGLSAIGNLKALDKGAEQAAKQLEKMTIAGEKFEVAMTRTIGNALIMMAHGPSVSGLMAAGSSVLGDLSKMQKTDDAGKVTTPLANLALPATILSVGGGLLSGLEGLFRSGVSIHDYSPTAIEQLRALMVQGGLVSMSVTNANGLSSSEAQNLIARNTSRDSVPRFPMQPAGAGR